MKERLPRLAIVSIGIRRDLLAPLRYFNKFELQHFYRTDVYGDLTGEDFDETLRPYSSPLELYRQLVHGRPDVIQGVEPFSFYTQPYLWACYFAARKAHSALLGVTLENRPPAVKFGRMRAFFLRNMLSVYFRHTCLILTLNRGARENVVSCGAPAERIHSALWGVWGADTQEFVPRTVREAGAPPTILFAGRLHPEKGIFVLLDAFVLLRSRIPTARLLVAGDGPAREQISEIIHRRSLAGNVQLLGTIKNRSMINLFHQADVLCAPSLTTRKWAEQVGASALQAMACGLPIVSTRSGSIPEYLPDRVVGILVEEGDSAALANALFALLSNPQQAIEMGQQGRAYAVAHYDARQNVERGETLVLEHCVRQHARRV